MKGVLVVVVLVVVVVFVAAVVAQVDSVFPDLFALSSLRHPCGTLLTTPVVVTGTAKPM